MKAKVAISKPSTGETAMEEASAAPPQDLAHLIVVSPLLSYFSILDLVYVSCTSKALGQLCQTELSSGSKQAAHALIYDASEDAAAFSQEETSPREVGQLPWKNLSQLICKGVEWLLTTSGIELSDTSDPNTAQTLQTLLHTWNVPLLLAQVLLAAGLQVGYEQLVRPARAGVRGLSVWRVALGEMELLSTLPKVSGCLLGISMHAQYCG